MGKICAVPDCQSGCYADRTRRKRLGLRQLTLFTIPKCSDRLRDWNRALGCDLTSSKFICQLHFSEADIKTSDKTLLPDGTVHELHRYHWYLAHGAVPISKFQQTSGEIPAEPANVQKDVSATIAEPQIERANVEAAIAIIDEKIANTTTMDIATNTTVTSLSASDKPIEKNDPNKTAVPRNAFTMDMLKNHLVAALLPESWVWMQRSSGIIFTLVDRLDFRPKLHLEVARDLSLQIRTNTDSIIPLHENATSIAVIRTYFQILKKIPTCSGTGYQHESRDPLCMGILDDSELYERQRTHTRCMACRRLRNKLGKQDKRRSVDGTQKYDRTQKIVDLARRRLAELNYSLKEVKLDYLDMSSTAGMTEPSSEEDTYTVAKSYFDLREYDRAAYFLQDCKTSKSRFLYLYSRYLSGERKKINDMTDVPPDPLQNDSLKLLCADLRKENLAANLDGFGLYLFGVTLKKLQLTREAIDALVESTHRQPMHWGTWLELAAVITDREKLEALTLPNHWMRHFFMAHMYLELQLLDEGLALYRELQSMGFERNGYVLAQTAIAVHYRRDVDNAMEIFKRIIKDDPYCLDNMDTYSNLLYVKELKVELAHLAHRATEIDKYRLETCCIVGNYYSLRADHQKAVMYFHRALKLNPQYLSAWTLLGHEFMEMKNTNGAIHSYRQAIEVNRRDYRAWYGLGQTYEILKMPFYGLYYYKQAQLLRPHDSRMVLALGEAYEKQDKIPDALKCYYKACNVGDIEGMALIKLATLYENLNEHDHAAAAYTDFVMDEFRNADRTELSHAYKFLTNYHLRKDQLDQASHYAQKCLQFDETKEEAKALLRTIAQKRVKVEENPMVIEDMNETDPVGEISIRNDATPGNQLAPMNLSFTPTQ